MTRFTRRSVLAGLGAGATTTLAGCSLLGESDERVEFDTDAVATIPSASVEESPIPVPVSPDQSAVEAGVDRVDELLAVVPEEISPDQIPNEAIRREITEQRRDAVQERQNVEAAPSTYHALVETESARQDAMEATAAFRATQDEETLDEVRQQQETVRDRTSTALGNVDYAGEDRERALYVADRVESVYTGALSWLESERRTLERSALTVGDVAGRVEYARASLDVGSHLTARHEARLSERQSFESIFEPALNRSVEALDDEQLPNRETRPSDVVDADIEETPALDVLYNALSGVSFYENSLREASSNGYLGEGIAAAYNFERDRRAYTTLRERIENGDFQTFEELDRLSQARQRAVDALDAIPYDTTAPSLPAAMAVRTRNQIAETDQKVADELDRQGDTVAAGSLLSEYAEYVWTAARLTAVPDAVETVNSRFDG